MKYVLTYLDLTGCCYGLKYMKFELLVIGKLATGNLKN